MTTEDTQTHEATQASPPPQPPPARPYPPLSALRRSRTDRKLAGVSGGLGRYAGVDPLIFRILFVLLTFFGGTGLLLYAAAWLLVPADGEAESEGQRLFNGRSSSSVSTVIAIVVVIVLGLAATGAMFDTGPGLGGLGVLIVIGVIVVLLFRNGQRPVVDSSSGVPYAPAYGPVPPPEPGAFGQTPGTAYAQPSPGYVPPGPPTYTAPTAPYLPPPPGPAKEKSVLGRVTVSIALIGTGLMVAWNSVSDDDFKVVAIFATALAVVAVGLIVGAFLGRARGLILLGILLTIATSISGAVDQHVEGGVGERTWVPTTVAEAERPFRLGVGDAELDLTGLPPGSAVDVDVSVGMGELRVIVPDDARVVVDGSVGAGTMRLFEERTRDGTGLSDRTTSDPSPGAAPGAPLLTIDAEVGLGELEVRR